MRRSQVFLRTRPSVVAMGIATLVLTPASGAAWNEQEARIGRVVDAATALTLVAAAQAPATRQAAEAVEHADLANKDAEARQKEDNEAEARVSRLASEKRRLEGVAKEAAATLAGLREERADYLKQLTAKDAEVARAREQMDEEDRTGRGRVDSRGNPESGKGPRWKALNATYQLRNAERHALEAAIRNLESNIAAADQKNRDADADVEKTALDLSNAETALQAIKAENLKREP